MNQLIISFYTVRTVLMQEVLISHTSKLIVILATIITLMNLIFVYFMPADKERPKQNVLQNLLVSLAVTFWSQYVFRPNLVYKLTNEWVVENSIYDWYFARSVELAIATVIVIRLVSYLVKQINVIVRDKELVVLELLKWLKASVDSSERGPDSLDIPPEVIEKMIAKINRKTFKREKNQMTKEKRKIKWGGIKTEAIKKATKWHNINKKWLTEFRENSTSGESLIVWIIGANKTLYTLMSLVLVCLYVEFGKTGLGMAWTEISKYLVYSGMDPLNVEAMKTNVIVSIYLIGKVLFLFVAMIFMGYLIAGRGNVNFRTNLIVRMTKSLYQSAIIILKLGVLVYIFSHPDPLTVKLLWVILILISAKDLNSVLTNFMLNRNQKVIFHRSYNYLVGEIKQFNRRNTENDRTEKNSDDFFSVRVLKNQFLVKEPWKKLIVLENTTYSKNRKEPYWFVEKTYRFRYTFFKFKCGIHVRSSVLDSMDMEDEGNSNKPGDSSFKAEDIYNPSDIIKYLELKEKEKKQRDEHFLQGEEDR